MARRLVISTDHSKTYRRRDEVRLYWRDDSTGEELAVTATDEGLVYDIYSRGDVIGTQSATVDEIVNSILGGE